MTKAKVGNNNFFNNLGWSKNGPIALKINVPVITRILFRSVI